MRRGDYPGPIVLRHAAPHPKQQYKDNQMPLIPQILAWQDAFARLRQQPHRHAERGFAQVHASRLVATYLNEA
jgi:hypothetical protein